MAVHDPIADALTIIRNGVRAKKDSVQIDYSTKTLAIVKILKEEGYVKNYRKLEPSVKEKRAYAKLHIDLKYVAKEGVLTDIQRISSPGLRQYASVDAMPRVNNGLGVAIISTSKGVITDKKARSLNVGGEVLCYVW